MTSSSFLDVVDDHLGVTATNEDVMRLSERELLNLADALTAFYLQWNPPSAQESAIRVFLASYSRGVEYTDWHPGMPIPTVPLQQLLYVDQLAIEDPASWEVARLAGAVDDLGGPAHWTLVQRKLASSVDAVRPCQTLVNDGALILTPGHTIWSNNDLVAEEIYGHPRFERENFEVRWNVFADAAAEEIAAIAESFGAPKPKPRAVDVGWDHGHPYPIEPITTTIHGDGRVSKDLFYGPSFRVIREVLYGLGGAASVNAELLPHSMYAEACYRALVASIAEQSPSSGSPSPLTVERALVSGLLPLLTDLPPRTLVAIRENDEDFAAWRADLRNAVRLIRTTPDQPGFSADAASVMQDTLVPRMNELRQSATVTSRLRRGTRDAAITFTVGALAGVSTGDISAGLAGAGTTASATLLLQALFPSRASGSQAVLLRLLPYAKKQ